MAVFGKKVPTPPPDADSGPDVAAEAADVSRLARLHADAQSHRSALKGHEEDLARQVAAADALIVKRADDVRAAVARLVAKAASGGVLP